MRLEELDLELPVELIAQEPVEPRDTCRLMVLDPDRGSVSHRRFDDLPALLKAGDVLVLNESRVLPARLHVTKETGGRVEMLFLHELAGDGPRGESWEVLARPSSRLREGQALSTAAGRVFRLSSRLGEGRWQVSLEGPAGVRGVLQNEGTVPLPPYITRSLGDPESYQTVYARVEGSAAAPTAGLHFTPQLLAALEARGVGRAEVTLHVGLDTFRPVTEERVEDHAIHTEGYEVSEEAVARMDAARAEGRRLVAVGTTSVRVLETLYRGAPVLGPHRAALVGRTDVFITPGHRFAAVDALITNFHLPRTSLLALVMAFAGTDLIREAYAEAVAARYRFFSFGDAMLVTGPAPPPAPGVSTP